jgi:hypothetical protein
MGSILLSKGSSNCMTFRIPTEKLNQLHKESEAKQISFNTLVNQLIKEHLDWHGLAAGAKLYYLPKSFLMRIVSQFTEQELSELARDTAKNDLVDINLFLRGRFTIASLFDITGTWLKMSHMPYRTEREGNTSMIVIQHGMGIKYSHLIKEISRYLLEVAFGAKLLYDITDDTIVLKLLQE